MKNLGHKGKHNLQARWSSIPYVVRGRMPNLPVYRVSPEHGDGGIKTLHRDHLLPIGQLVRLPKSELESPARLKTTASRKSKKISPALEQISQDLESDSSSDFEYYSSPRSHRPCMKNRTQRAQNAAEQSLSVNIQADDKSPGQTTEISEEDKSEEEVLNEEHQHSGLESAIDSEQEDAGQEEVMNTYRGESPREEDRVSSPESRIEKTTETHPKRAVKPVVKLTYDKPGRSKDQPIIIINRGIVIKIGES